MGHSGLGLLTPHDVHSGVAEHRVAARATVLAAAYAAHPERFPAGQPQPLARPVEVRINRPKPRATEEVAHSNSCSTILDALRASRYARSTLGAAGN